MALVAVMVVLASLIVHGLPVPDLARHRPAGRDGVTMRTMLRDRWSC